MMSRATYARDSLRTAPNIFGRALTTGRTIADVEAWPERIDAVTLEQVNEAARSVFEITHSMTSILLPKKGE
jgi:zinc protease